MSKNDVAKIKSNVRRYVAACNAGDADAFQKTLANDAIFMPPDAPRMKGNKKIAAWGKETFFDPFRNKLQIKFDRIQVIGAEAFGYGPFRLELTPKSGAPTVKGTGKHTAMFKKQKDGSWKYAQAIWNFDKPPNGGAASQGPDLGVRIRSASEALLKKGNVARAREIFSPNYVVHFNGQDLRGTQAIEQFITELRSAFPDLRYEIAILASAGDKVSWTRTHHGTHKGTFMGVPASGRSMAWRDMVVSRFTDGKIAEEWAVTDLGEQLRN